MAIKIYNTLTRKKELFKPLEPGHVKLYVCGITSYDYCHIGHARSALIFDMIVAYLRFREYKVTYIRNFTDIDDKIINRAAEQDTTPTELANRFIDEFHIDMDKLGVARPSLEPKATENIQEMIDFISELIDKDMAYPSGNDVYYSVSSFKEYGKLSGRNLEDMQAGARVTVNELKKNPYDFVLWKGSKPGEPQWDSPWGPGRPGWHIECSAMCKKFLGQTFDIHGGGQDLVFPHHENELAQSEGANNKPFVTTWVHHGFVTIKDEKMSKSLGNFLTIRDITENYHSEVLRFFIFSTQYRNPLEFSENAMQDAIAGLDRLYECVATVEELQETPEETGSVISANDINKIAELKERFYKAMDNDFNTAQAQGVLFEIAKLLNKLKNQLEKTCSAEDKKLMQSTLATLRDFAGIMGILKEDARTYLAEKKAGMLTSLEVDEATINSLIQQRYDARSKKDWQRSDEIRDELVALGIVLKDGPEGTSWSVKRTS